ncbi:hypothetical protein [Phenylobacterium sp.]|uniref:hypothetical protein n=1 Tax=Phenylobacterium sp. TaxID=1871053 RepID=UPI00260BAEF0|nr:hypothetical protein [Phenylobacterium sp.]
MAADAAPGEHRTPQRQAIRHGRKLFLAFRKLVERAKALLMKTHGKDEGAIYRLLRCAGMTGQDAQFLSTPPVSASERGRCL